MNYGPLIFLGAFFALAASWFGFVLTPQLQLGHLQPTNTVPSTASYPQSRPGLAQQGLQVYRANGCAYCHSQQVGQSGLTAEVVLSDIGTNREAVIATLRKLSAPDDVAGLPKTVVRNTSKPSAEAALKQLKAAGAKADLWIVPSGPDIARGWGKRRTVAEDFLFDSQVMPGSQRIGPDLANVGARLPDPNWHLRHLYQPDVETKGSTMPPYRFLFTKRKIQRAPSADALPVSGTQAGYEIVPTGEARALAAYLVSLRADAPLFVAPVTVAPPAVPSSDTNAPGSTNAIAGSLTNLPASGVAPGATNPAPTNAP